MGAKPSAPRSGAEFQVIGAGLSRTGTASFSEALRILLGGPVYHGGTQSTTGEPIEIRSWIKALSCFPPKSRSDIELMHKTIRDRLTGYVAVTDAPCSGLVPEVLEVFPDAKVICTVRDTDGWVRSMAGVATASTKGFLRVVLFPLPQMRYFVDYINVLRDQWIHLYGEREPVTAQTYHRHMEYLKKTVPEDRLFFFDVRDGWEPLCKILEKPIPDVPFPRVNDGEAIERFSKKALVKGLTRWAVMIGAAAGILLAIRMGFNYF